MGRQVDAIAAEAGGHGGVEGVGNAPGAEQPGAVRPEPVAALPPDGDDAGHVRRGRRVQVRDGAQGQVHGAGAAQGLEAGMHLRRHRPRHGPGGAVGGPELRGREPLRQIFADGQAVPDRQVAVLQRRDLAAGGDGADLVRRPVPAQADQKLLEGLAGAPERQPRPQGPGGPGLGADDELHGGTPLRGARSRPHMCRWARPAAPGVRLARHAHWRSAAA